MLTRSIRFKLNISKLAFLRNTVTRHGYVMGTKNPRILHVGETNNELHLIAVEKYQEDEPGWSQFP